MKRIKEFFESVMSQWAAKRQKKHLAELNRRSCDELQVVEFEGELFLSYHSIPLVNVALLKDNVIKTLTNSRSVWVQYHLRNTNECKQ